MWRARHIEVLARYLVYKTKRGSKGGSLGEYWVLNRELESKRFREGQIRIIVILTTYLRYR